MTVREESSSDLALARRLSRWLSTSGPPPSDLSAGEGRSVLADALSPAQAPSPPQAQVTAPGAPTIEGGASTSSNEPARAERPSREPMRIATWEELLDWCLELHPSTVAFVVEPQGFVIASRGSWSFSDLEGIGPQLISITGLARELGESRSARTVSLQLESFWLSGLVVPRSDMGEFIIAFIGESPLEVPTRDLLDAQARFNIDHL